MNAEKLPIVPTKDQLHKPSVLVPVLHSAGRAHTGRLAVSAMVAGWVCILPGRGRYARCVHGDRATTMVDDAKDSSSKIIIWR